MRPLPSVGGEVVLPAIVEELLIDVATDGFTLYCCGPKTAPNALVAVYEWSQYVDLLTIRDFARVTTARVPKQAGWTSSPPRSWSGPTKAPRSRRYGPCLNWCTQRTPTPPPRTIRHPRACTFPAPSYVRRRSDRPHPAKRECGRTDSPPR